jgi:CTP:molybdopterin cytidylyltransferase MocA
MARVADGGDTGARRAGRRAVAAVLAAGGGSRFAAADHKLLHPLRGRPLATWAIGAAVASGLTPVFVVVGAVDLTPVLEDAGLAAHVELVPNPAWADGQAGSLAHAVAAADAAGADAVVVGLADQPFVTAEAWRRVAAVSDAAPIRVATYGGRRRNPVGLHRSVWPELPRDGDEGARVLMSRRPELVTEVPCPGEPADVDTMEDLDRWT